MSKQKIDAVRLITEIYKQPALWDQKHILNNNREAVERIWKNLSDDFNVPASSIKSRWKGLRDTFRGEMKKILAHRKNKTKETRTLWRHYHRLIFLKDQMAPRIGMPTWAEIENSNELRNSDNFVSSNNNQHSNEESSDTDISIISIIDDNNRKRKVSKQNTPVNKLKVVRIGDELNSQQLQRRKKPRLENVNEYSSNGFQNPSSSSSSSGEKIILKPNTVVSTSGNVIGTMYQVLGSVQDLPDRGEDLNSAAISFDPTEPNFVSIKEEHGNFINGSINSSMRNSENFDMNDAQVNAGIIAQSGSLHESVNSLDNNEMINSVGGNQHDDNYHFLMSLLPHMKKLTGGRGMALKMQLQELVYKEVYKK